MPTLGSDPAAALDRVRQLSRRRKALSHSEEAEYSRLVPIASVEASRLFIARTSSSRAEFERMTYEIVLAGAYRDLAQIHPTLPPMQTLVQVDELSVELDAMRATAFDVARNVEAAVAVLSVLKSLWQAEWTDIGFGRTEAEREAGFTRLIKEELELEAQYKGFLKFYSMTMAHVRECYEKNSRRVEILKP